MMLPDAIPASSSAPRPSEGPSGVFLRNLGPDDASAVMALHHDALSRLASPGLVRRETPEFFVSVLSEGLSIGLYCEAGETGNGSPALTGYALLQTRLEPGDDPAARLGLPGTAFAKLCGCTIAPQWQGRGFQASLTLERLRLAQEAGYRHAFATAAPANPASWRSLVRAGLTLATLGPVGAAGALRYTLALDCGFPTGPGVRIRQDALSEQARLMDQGWRGIDCPDSATVLFRRWDPR